jgi:hypothetical protein
MDAGDDGPDIAGEQHRTVNRLPGMRRPIGRQQDMFVHGVSSFAKYPYVNLTIRSMVMARRLMA